MFWGLIMESGKRYTQTVERAFHVSMACLEPNTADTDNVSVMLAFENREFILCNLNKHKAIQTPLDLNFQSGDKIAFMSSGRGRVHLTGYLLETDDEDEDDDDDDEEEDAIMNDDSMDIEILSKKQINDLNKGSGKRKNEPQLSKAENKKTKLAEPESDEVDDDDDVDDDDLNLAGDSDDMLEDTSEDEDDDENDDDDDDDDDEDNSEEEMQTSPKPQQQQQQQQQKTPLSKKKEKKMVKTPNETPQQHKLANEKQKTPNQKEKMKALLEQQQNKKTPNEKQQQKNKTPNEKHQQGGSTPKQSPGSQVNGITQQQSGKKNKKGVDTPKGGKSPGGDSPLKKVLEGGVIIEEVRVGNGPVAKPGRQVTVYYIGRLKQNNKQFDCTTEGSGFKFRLGRGEVIRGWDIGVSGMKTGGKRKITCPAPLAYGNKGSPPAIPPNSCLVFDVELKAVN